MKQHNIVNLKHLLFFVGFSISATVFGQQRTITLNEAIDLSLKNSKQLKIGSARIMGANAVLTEAEDNRLPGFNVSGSYLRLMNPNISLKTKAFSRGSSSDSSRQPSPTQAIYGIASLTYPLYAGGRIKYGIESAKLLQKAANLDVENDKQGVILNTIDAFINLYKSEKVITLFRRSLEESRKRDTDFLRLENNGIMARNDRLKASLQTSNIELSLLDAENNNHIANVNLDLMLGLSENTILLPDSLSLQPVTQNRTLDEYEKLALHRKDLEAISFRQKASASQVKIARGLNYPGIALTGGYIAASIPGLLTITNAVNAGLGIQYNLAGLWKTNTSIQKARARENELLADAEQLSDAIRLQVNKDYENYLLSTKKIDVYNNALVQAKENYRITRNKYNNSLVTTTDLLEADVAQLQAELNLAIAQADKISLYNKLLATAGSLNTK